MAILGNIVARSLHLRKRLTTKVATPEKYQLRVLRQLLEKAQYTKFGKHYGYSEILSNELDFYKAFRKQVPIFTYNEMYRHWICQSLEGEENVSWPGKIKYFALSSGTSESSSKHIPVTKDMIKSIKNAGFKQLFSMANYKIPPIAYQKGILMLGGTTSLFEKGEYYEGDMSGISAATMPRWLSNFFYKPGQRISLRPNWEDRIKLIVRNAKNWDVGTVCGVPAWVQIVFEKIIKYHKVNHIHEIWPNLSVYIHGGVAFEPYRESFKQLLGKPITFIETYMASEGSFGFQARPNTPGIKLVLNNGIFYEFVPFTRDNFDEEGNIKENAKSYLIHQVDEVTEYAVVLSTCAGLWRYVIGDVIKFSNANEAELVIVGRTKQFLSLCGEHMSVDNINKTIEVVAKEMDITIREFAVGGFPYQNLFAHRWFIGCDDPHVDTEKIKQLIDKTLCELNDDYAVERTSALKEIFVEVLPEQHFYDYLKAIGKDGAMNKFPRVLKGEKLKEWELWLAKNKHSQVV